MWGDSQENAGCRAQEPVGVGSLVGQLWVEERVAAGRRGREREVSSRAPLMDKYSVYKWGRQACVCWEQTSVLLSLLPPEETRAVAGDVGQNGSRKEAEETWEGGPQVELVLETGGPPCR